ncbi:hypothetical protein Bca52824_073955 [Brassica carinata]|uniref:Uncharacterized protein n=1 Tax=Brassica carinata TaxID=52824 RepID=A0A8X7QAW5_BRACI|nr:hypothetical protein Bca52824_073955 [Brassica carinata]
MGYNGSSTILFLGWERPSSSFYGKLSGLMLRRSSTNSFISPYRVMRDNSRTITRTRCIQSSSFIMSACQMTKRHKALATFQQRYMETSSVQCIHQQYTAAFGGRKLQNSIKNAYAMGKLKMITSEL